MAEAEGMPELVNGDPFHAEPIEVRRVRSVGMAVRVCPTDDHVEALLDAAVGDSTSPGAAGMRDEAEDDVGRAGLRRAGHVRERDRSVEFANEGVPPDLDRVVQRLQLVRIDAFAGTHADGEVGAVPPKDVVVTGEATEDCDALGVRGAEPTTAGSTAMAREATTSMPIAMAHAIATSLAALPGMRFEYR